MKKLLAGMVLVAVGMGTVVVYGQDTRNAPPAAPAPGQSDHGMMMGGNMQGMMERMSRMMDACEKMMQARPEDRSKG